MRTRRRPEVPRGAYQEPLEGLYTLILSGRRIASSGRTNRDHAPPGRTACAALRRSDSPQAQAAPRSGRPVPPGCPAAPPSCRAESFTRRRSEEGESVFTPLRSASKSSRVRRGKDPRFLVFFSSRARATVAPVCSHRLVLRPGTGR